MDTQTHPLSTRIAHWGNALIIGALLVTGFSMFSRDRDFAFFVHLLPAGFWNLLHFTGSRRHTVTWHEWIGVAMAANGLLYAVFSLRNGSWRNIALRGSWLKDAIQAAVAELRGPREAMQPLPYNAAQRLAYTSILAMGALMVLTGAALWFKHQIPWLLAALGGEHVVLPAHIIIATSFVLFIAVHVSQVLRAGWPTLRSMLAGPARTDSNVNDPLQRLAS